MNDEQNQTGMAQQQPTEHPLVAAMKDMARMASTAKGVRMLGRIHSGIQNRVSWIENRQKQIDALTKLQQRVCDAYDRGNADLLNALEHEIQDLVTSDERTSPLEREINAAVEIMEAEIEDDNVVSPGMKRASRATFKGTRA